MTVCMQLLIAVLLCIIDAMKNGADKTSAREVIGLEGSELQSHAYFLGGLVCLFVEGE